VLNEYQKAPQVTRDRMYIDAMQQIYSNVTKVLIESKQGSNLLYLPLDKILQATQSGNVPTGAVTPPSNSDNSNAASSAVTADPRNRDGSRSRDRDAR
jgi:membrane protease subunit HflK